MITVFMTLLCVFVGLWYIGFFAGVRSPLETESQAKIYDCIPDIIKKIASGLRHVVVKTLQFLLYLLKANNVHVITVAASAPGDAEWEKSMLSKEVTRLEGEVLDPEVSAPAKGRQVAAKFLLQDPVRSCTVEAD